MTDSGTSDFFSAIAASYLSSCIVEDFGAGKFGTLLVLGRALLELGHIYLNPAHHLHELGLVGF